MNAENWLENEELCNPLIQGSHPADDLFPGYKCSTVMERYANNKTKELQAQILEYRQRLKKLKDGEEIERMFVTPGEFIMSEILEDYDKHFNLTTERYGNNNR